MKRSLFLAAAGILILSFAGLAACSGGSNTTAGEVSCQPVTPADGAQTILLPGGTFTMGSQAGSSSAGEDEFPAHEVTLSCFSIYQQEVTNGMYKDCVAAGACLPLTPVADTMSARYADSAFNAYPVVGVDHLMASDYCAWAGGRLPTEAEWEYAATRSQEILFPWGDEPPDCEKANFLGCLDPAETIPGGTLTPGESPDRVQDLAGNAWEWVFDWYDPGYYSVSPSTSPLGPLSGEKKVARGGAYDSDLHMLFAANRHAGDPNRAYSNVGFRCVLGSTLELPADYVPDIPDFHRVPERPDPLDGDDPQDDPVDDDVNITTHPLNCPDNNGNLTFVVTVIAPVDITTDGFKLEGVAYDCDPYDPVTQTFTCVVPEPAPNADPWWDVQFDIHSNAWNYFLVVGTGFNKPANCDGGQPPASECALSPAECTSETSIGFLVNVTDSQTQQGVVLQDGSVSGSSGILLYNCDLVPNFDGRVYCSGPLPGPASPGFQLDYTIAAVGPRSCTWDANDWLDAIPDCTPPDQLKCADYTTQGNCEAAGCKWVTSAGGIIVTPYCTNP